MGAKGIGMSCQLLAAAAVVAVMAILGTASAATYNVGEPGGAWDRSTNYVDWVSSKKFHPGDEIVFKYSPQSHDVLEVNKANYDSCTNSNPIATHTTGSDVVPLNSTGTRYFICGVPGHCATTGTGLMKVKIDVVPASDSSSPAPAGAGVVAGAPPSSGAGAPPSSAATSLGATASFGLAVMLAARLMA